MAKLTPTATSLITRHVYVTTSFAAFHRWKDAPDEVAFLREWHRHLFNVKLTVPVSHGDREVEFFILKKAVEAFILEHYTGKQFEKSCEMIAEELLRHFAACSVEVSEDGENGAVVTAAYILEDPEEINLGNVPGYPFLPLP